MDKHSITADRRRHLIFGVKLAGSQTVKLKAVFTLRLSVPPHAVSADPFICLIRGVQTDLTSSCCFWFVVVLTLLLSEDVFPSANVNHVCLSDVLGPRVEIFFLKAFFNM